MGGLMERPNVPFLPVRPDHPLFKPCGPQRYLYVRCVHHSAPDPDPHANGACSSKQSGTGSKRLVYKKK